MVVSRTSTSSFINNSKVRFLEPCQEPDLFPPMSYPMHYSSSYCKPPALLHHLEQQQMQQQHRSKPLSPSIHKCRFNPPNNKRIAPTQTLPNASSGAAPSPLSEGHCSGSLRGTFSSCSSSTSSSTLGVKPRSRPSEDTEAWRKYGKEFRANLMLEDDANGGNAFSVNDFCNIEKYYRVADRVLEQFLACDISERENMIENYLIANRLFKFLSIVLPTHQDYFSPDSRLAALRSRSQAQLIELLEYIEELEMMIDEMEYSNFILTDLTPGKTFSKGADDTVSTANNTMLSSSADDDYDCNNDMDRKNATGFTFDEDNFVNSGSNDTERLPQPSKPTWQESPNFGSSSQNSQDAHASHRKTVKSQSSRKDLEQKVAAVVAASNTADVPSERTMRSVSSGDRSVSFQLQTTSTKQSSTILRPPLTVPRKSSIKGKGAGGSQKESMMEPSGHFHDSWDVSTFDSTTAFENSEQDSFVTLDSESRIDLLLEDPVVCPTERKSAPRKEKPPSILKNQRVTYPRNVRVQPQMDINVSSRGCFQAADLNGNESTRNAAANNRFSTCSNSSDIRSSSNEPSDTAFAPLKSKIEERLERAALAKEIDSSCKYMYHPSVYEDVKYGNLGTLDLPVERKLLHQFRGCIRSLLD